MAFDLHISIPDDSPALEIVRRVAQAERITPDQAAARLLDEAARRHGEEAPVGFGRRQGPRLPRPDAGDPEAMIGMFEDKPGFIETMESVVARRADRYASPR